MNILVTGGSGFVGRAVVRELQWRGHEVHVLTRRHASKTFGGNTTFVCGDLTSARTITDLIDENDFDGICHLAGLTGVRDSFSRPVAYFDVNVGGTVNLLRAVQARYARTAAPTRIVFASSRAVYANTGDIFVSEAYPAVPVTPYGVTKRVVEQLLDFETRSGALGATVLRCFNVAGGAEGIVDSDTKRVIPQLIGVIDGSLPPVELGSLRNQRDFVHVLDVGRAFATALERAEPGKYHVYNVGTGHGTTIKEVLALLEQISGRTIPMETRGTEDPPDADQGLADISLIRNDLGWAPTLKPENIMRDSWRFAQAASQGTE